jgi:hypothetical protein
VARRDEGEAAGARAGLGRDDAVLEAGRAVVLDQLQPQRPVRLGGKALCGVVFLLAVGFAVRGVCFTRLCFCKKKSGLAGVCAPRLKGKKGTVLHGLKPHPPPLSLARTCDAVVRKVDMRGVQQVF